jgi:hypothetical protein
VGVSASSFSTSVDTRNALIAKRRSKIENGDDEDDYLSAGAKRQTVNAERS